MATPPEAAEQQEKEALRSWSSTKYAISKKLVGDAWRKGIKWMLVDQEGPERGNPPFLTRGSQWCEKIPSTGNFLVTDNAGTVIEITPTYDIEWKYGGWKDYVKLSDAIFMAQYLPDEDSFVISDSNNGRILKVDKETKDVEEELTSIDSGDLSFPIARWEFDRDELLLVDRDNHYFATVDWAGNENVSFGAWGTAGSDDSHLDSPQRVAPDRYEVAVIADRNNDRAVTVQSDGTLRFNYIYPDVGSVFVSQLKDGSLPYYGTNYVMGSQRSRVGLVAEFGEVLNILPFGITWGSISTDYTLIFRRHRVIREVDIRSWVRNSQRPARGLPFTDKVMDSVTLDANASGDTYPFYRFPYDKVMVKALSTQSATLDIYTLSADDAIQADSIPATWLDYDSVSLSADTPENYVVTGGAEVMGAQVTMGGTSGNVDLWIHYAR